jgi:FkbM family methyltransferase
MTFAEKISRFTQQHPALRRALWPAVLLRRQLRRNKKKPGAEGVTARLASMLAEDPVLNVAEFEGKFALSARGHLFRRLIEDGEYEPVLTRRCLELLDPQRDVIDVGANIGFHTVLLAKRIGARRVLAVEPTRNALARLRRNIALNGVDAKVSVFEGVVSDALGSLEIKTIAGLEEYSSLGVMEHPSIVGAGYVTEEVEARTLDQLVDEHGLDCGFLKVDVEGVEHKVFSGGRGLLTQSRPVVLSELSNGLLQKNGSSALEIVQLFEALDYVVTDPLRPGEKPGFRDFGDILCVPRERGGADAR